MATTTFKFYNADGTSPLTTSLKVELWDHNNALVANWMCSSGLLTVTLPTLQFPGRLVILSQTPPGSGQWVPLSDRAIPLKCPVQVNNVFWFCLPGTVPLPPIYQTP